MRWRRRGLSACAGGFAVCGVALLCAGGARAAFWSLQPTPTLAGAEASVLSAVSCPSARTCTAVGDLTDAAGDGVTLAEHWSGGRWAAARTPGLPGSATGLLFGVSCPTPRWCAAVGSVTGEDGVTEPLAERWTGARWTVTRIAPIAGRRGAEVAYLAAVSCAAPARCVAVGYAGNAAGTSGRAIVARLGTGGWSTQPAPAPSGISADFLSAVSCSSRSRCTAVGDALRRTGLATVLAARLDGRRWSLQTAPTPLGATTAMLAGVSCPAADSCTAVGSFTDVAGIEVMLAEGWDGHRWSIEDSRYPAGARYVRFSGVSCPSVGSCTAVGLSNDVAGADVTLVERRDRRGWRVQRTPRPAAVTDALAAVACPTPTACTAVGGLTTAAGAGFTLAQRWNQSG